MYLTQRCGVAEGFGLVDWGCLTQRRKEAESEMHPSRKRSGRLSEANPEGAARGCEGIWGVVTSHEE